MKYFFAIQVIILVFVGCSSSFHVQPEKNRTDPKSISYAKLNSIMRENIGGPVDILMMNGEERRVEDVQMQQDSTGFIDGVTGQLQKVSTDSIRLIRRKDRIAGLYEGLMFGTLIGGGIPLGVFLATKNESSEGESGLAYAFLALGGMMAGGGIGIIYGGVRGHTYTYDLGRDSTSDIHPGKTP